MKIKLLRDGVQREREISQDLGVDKKDNLLFLGIFKAHHSSKKDNV